LQYPTIPKNASYKQKTIAALAELRKFTFSARHPADLSQFKFDIAASFTPLFIYYQKSPLFGESITERAQTTQYR
jgi:hypothetical protein